MNNKVQAFMLAEAVFSIFITIVVIMILRTSLLSLKTADHGRLKTNELAYSYVQLNHFLHDTDVEKVYLMNKVSNSKKAVLCKVVKNGKDLIKKQYILEQHDSMLRMTTNQSGHMPLLLHVKQIQFDNKDTKMKINVVEQDNRTSELVFKLDPEPETIED